MTVLPYQALGGPGLFLPGKIVMTKGPGTLFSPLESDADIPVYTASRFLHNNLIRTLLYDSVDKSL